MERHCQMLRVWFVAALVVALVSSAEAQGRPARAAFVFGDSLVDPGNNNYIASLARANFLPNGIDFKYGPTGRFSNGRTVADAVCDLLGIPYLPPYLDPKVKGAAILGGISYASAAGGILDKTGYSYVQRISQNNQLRFFRKTQQEFIDILGPEAANQVFADSLYFIGMGSNDYINNYLTIGSSTPRQYTVKEYEALLVQEFRRQTIELYNLGARKMCVFNVGPLGCIPNQLAQKRVPDGKCIRYINEYVEGFNAALGADLVKLAAELPGATIIVADAYTPVIDRINNPQKYGLVNVNEGCCGIGMYHGLLPCFTGMQPCSQRDNYLFWDPFHPTDAVNSELANLWFYGDKSVVTPMNIKQLSELP